MTPFDSWVRHFEANTDRHAALEADIDWEGYPAIDARTRTAFVRSFRRFELGESGDGRHLLAMAAAAGDPVYTKALGLLVLEEQKHSALFGRGLRYLDASSMDSHWTDAAFTRLRRLLGLRTEIGLLLIAESVAMGYFDALAEHAPDPVLRGIGNRIATDERNHIRFQIDRLRVGFRHTPAPLRLLVGSAWALVAAGAATVLVVDHGTALRACGIRPTAYWGRAMRSFRAAARSALAADNVTLLGPTNRTMQSAPAGVDAPTR